MRRKESSTLFKILTEETLEKWQNPLVTHMFDFWENASKEVVKQDEKQFMKDVKFSDLNIWIGVPYLYRH